MKKKLLSLFTIILSACAIGFISTIGLFNTNAQAQGAQVEFEMLGASLRLGIDYNDDSTGLRFAAQVDKSVSAQVAGDANKSFGGIIVPANLIYADDETGRPAYKAGENLFNYMAEYHPSVALAYKDGLTVGSRSDYDIVALSLTNVANKNLARDFFGAIYIKEGSNYTFAKGNTIKSVHYVAAATVADTEAYLTDEQKPVAVDIAKQAGYVASQGSANVQNGVDLSSVVASMELASFYDFKANEWNETTLEYAYAKTGKVNYDVIIRNDKYGTEEETVFNAYREYFVDVEDRKYINVDQETGEITVMKAAFNNVEDDTLTVNVKMHVFDTIIDVPVTITNNVDAIAAEVSAKLAEASLTTIADAYDGIDLYTARFAYEELSIPGKAAVDAETYANFQAKESEYAQNFSIISGPLDYSKTSYVGGDLAVNEFVEDSTYGLVYEMKYNDNPGNGYVLVKLYAQEAFASGKKVYISIFNGGDEDATVLYLKDNAYWTKSDIVVPAGQWKEVMIDSGLLSGDTIGLVTTDAPGKSYKFTMMYTMSDAYVAGQIEEIIAELPETIEGHKYGPIAEAKKLYALLSEEGKALVTSWATLEAKDAQYAEKYQSVLVMDDAAMFYQNVNSFGDIATWAYDTNSTYGNVIVGTGKATGAAVIKSDIALPDLSIAKTINIWVYKNTAGRFNFCQNGNWNTMHNINANTWTLISFPASELKSFELGFWDVNAGDTIMFSSVWADTYVPEIKAMEAQIAGLTGEDTDAIVRAFDAYNALPTGVQNAISNKDVLLGYVDAFNTTLINRAIESIDLVPASPAGNQYGLILAAKEAYNKVPNELKSQVTNYSNLSKAETAWKNNYVLLAPMQEGSLTDISANYGSSVSTSRYEVVENYGKVLVFDVTKAGTIAFSYSAQSNMAGIKSVVFTIYNGSNTARPLDTWNSGSATGTGTSLVIGWNTVEIAMDGNYKGITTSDAGNGYTNYNGKFGIWGATPGTWYIASVYFNTYWADVDAVQAMINALVPGDEPAINEAREAYTALPEEMKEYVNIAYLEECEASLGELRVKAVIDLIDTLPEILSPYDINLIEKIRARFDLLSDADKENVTNAADLEAAEANYAKYFVLGASASAYDDKTTGWIGGAAAIAKEQDETFGALHTVTFSTLSRDGTIGFKTGAAATVKDYDKAVMYIYNGGTQNAYAMQLIAGAWTKLDVLLVAGEWTKVEFDPANFDTNYIFGAINVAETGVTFKFSSMWLYTDDYTAEMGEIVKVQEAIAAIDAIPETIKEYSYVSINAARAAVNAVSEAGQAQISNLADLQAAETEYNTYYKLVTAANTYSDATANWMGGGDAKAMADVDPVYGDVYALTYAIANNQNGVGFKFANEGDLAQYGEIAFYIYNGGSTGVNLKYVNAGGGWITGTDVLPAGEWSKVVVDATDIYSGKLFFVINGELNATYKFSSLFAYTEAYNDLLAQEDVQKVIEAINTLPEEIDVYSYYDIQAVQTVVSSLPEEYLGKVTNLATFEAYKAQYNASYVMINPWISTQGVNNISSNYVVGTTQVLSIVDDEVYGKLIKIEHTGTGAIALEYTPLTTTIPEGWIVNFTGYNGGSSAHPFDICEGGSFTGVGFGGNAQAGQWLTVEIGQADLKFRSATTGRIGFWGATPGTYYIAPIFAVNPEALQGANIDAAIEAIDTLPEEINAYSYYDIQAVQAIVDVVPESYRDKITNLATFEAIKAEYNKNYLMVRDWSNTEGISNISGVYKAGTTQVFSVVDYDNYGKVLKVEHNADEAVGQAAVWAIDYTALTTTIPEGWVLMFTVYNGGSTAHAIDICQTGDVTGSTYVNAPAGEWIVAEIKADSYKFYSATNGRFDVWNATTGTYYLASIYAVNPELLEGEAIQAAIDAIDAIPETLEGYEYGYILAAQDAVNVVSEAGQAQIINLAELEIAKAAYEEKFVAVLPIHSSYTFNQDLNVGGDIANYEFVLDQEYGYVLQGEVHANGAATIKLPSGSAPDLSMSTTVYVWVYKSGTDGAFRPYQSGSWDTIVNVPADTWTLVEIPASEYYFGRFGMWNSKVGETIKFSMFWADLVTEQVNAAIEAIDSLPETIKEYDLEKIQAAREVVNELPEAFINSNYIPNIADLEAAETYYNTYFYTIASANAYIDKTADMMGGGNAQVEMVEDAIAGSVYAMTYVVENPKNGVMFRFANEGDLASYGRFALYFYNGGSTVASVEYVNAGGSWVTGQELPVGEWTKVMFDATNIYSGKVIGIRNGELGATYKFTSLYGYTEAYGLLEAQEAIETAEAVIDLIPETLEGYQYNYILDAEAAINAVPAKYQAYIENINVYNAAVEQYNANYVAVLPMMTADKYYEKSSTFGELSTAKVEDDATYGKVLVRDVHTAGAQVNYYDGGISADLSGVSKVSIYVYKNTAGNYNASNGWSMMISVPAATWTRIDMNVADLRTDAFGMWGAIVGETIKYTMMWADKPAKLAQAAIAQIEELPDGNSEFDYAAIEAARATVDALPAEVLEYITNLSKLENAEATYNSLYALVANAASYQDITSGWIGGSNTYGKEEDPDYGTVFTSILSTMNGDGRIAFRLSPSVAVTNFPAIAMYIYNGSMDDVNLMILTGGSSWDAYDVLPANQWTRVVMDTTKFGADPIMGLKFVKDTEAQFKFTNAFGLTEYGMALAPINAANEALANMPQAINAYSIYDLREIRAIVNEVPEAYRTSEYLPELTAFEALEAEYAESYVVVRTWDDTTGISNISANYSAGTTQTLSIAEDATYGKVLKIEHTGTGALALEYTALTTDMSSATKLIFVGYNGGAKAHPFDICQGGSFTGAGFGGNAPVGQWFTVEINAADYTFRSATTGRIGFWGATEGTYYIAAIIAENAQAVINRAIRAIDALPEVITGESAGLIATARAAVNEVPVDAQAQITNLAVLQAAEAQFALDYAIVSTVDTYVYDANMGGTAANAQVVNTAEYGNVFKYTKVTTGGVVYKFTPSVTIANYAKLYFAVRLSASANIGLNVGGWNTEYQKVAANEWTIVEVTAADLASNAIGVWGGAADMTIEISAVWAVIELPQDNVDQEDPFN